MSRPTPGLLPATLPRPIGEGLFRRLLGANVLGARVPGLAESHVSAALLARVLLLPHSHPFFSQCRLDTAASQSAQDGGDIHGSSSSGSHSMLALEEGTEATVVINERGMIQLANKQLCDLWGQSAGALTGKNVSIKSASHWLLLPSPSVCSQPEAILLYTSYVGFGAHAPAHWARSLTPPHALQEGGAPA